MKKLLLITILLLIIMVSSVHAYTLFKCPAFPNGYALPKDVLIKLFAMQDDLKFGKIAKMTFAINTNKNLGKVKFKLYGGIPKNPLAALVDFIPPTAEVEAEWKDGAIVVFDSLDILVLPGYPESFMLKAEPDGLDDGDWLNVSVNIDGEQLTREIKFFY